jgi:hypothetical protein
MRTGRTSTFRPFPASFQTRGRVKTHIFTHFRFHLARELATKTAMIELLPFAARLDAALASPEGGRHADTAGTFDLLLTRAGLAIDSATGFEHRTIR